LVEPLGEDSLYGISPSDIALAGVVQGCDFLKKSQLEVIAARLQQRRNALASSC
jgi:hypothetical protein